MLKNLIKWIFVGMACLIIHSTLHAKEELFLMPKDQKTAINQLIKAFQAAKNNISIAIYSFTNKEIAKALRDAAAKGVKITIIYDEESNTPKNKNSTIGYLGKLNNIRACTLKGKPSKNGKYFGLMHMKMAIIDDNQIFLGSANWSKNAFENSYETLFLTDNADIIKKASNYFSDMSQRCIDY